MVRSASDLEAEADLNDLRAINAILERLRETHYAASLSSIQTEWWERRERERERDIGESEQRIFERVVDPDTVAGGSGRSNNGGVDAGSAGGGGSGAQTTQTADARPNHEHFLHLQARSSTDVSFASLAMSDAETSYLPPPPPAPHQIDSSVPANAVTA